MNRGGLWDTLARLNAPVVAGAAGVIFFMAALVAGQIARQRPEDAPPAPTAPPEAPFAATSSPPRLNAAPGPFSSGHLQKVIAQRLEEQAEAKRKADEDAKRKAAAAALAAQPPQPAVPPLPPPRQITILYRGLIEGAGHQPVACLELVGTPGPRFHHAGDHVEWVRIEAIGRDAIQVEDGGRTIQVPRGTPVIFVEAKP